jgi:hypothetical protein
MSTPPAAPRRRVYGVGRVLITVYAILAIGATARALYQILTLFSTGPVPITLSAVSGVIYVLATVALILPGPTWYRVAWTTISFELAGVIVVGTLSLLLPATFAPTRALTFGTVWSYYGAGYLLIPLALPILGMLYLRRRRPVLSEA